MFDSRFVRTLALGIVIIQLLVYGLLLIIPERVLQTEFNAAAQQAARQKTVLLAELLAVRLSARNSSQATLMKTLELLRDEPNLRYATVFDSSRKLLASMGEPPLLTQGALPDSSARLTVTEGLIAIEQPIIVQDRPLGMLLTGYAQRAGWDRTLLWTLLGITCGGLFLTALTVSIFSHSARRGGRQIVNAIAALRRDQWEQRVAPEGVLGDLLDSFNELATHIQARQHEAAEQYEDLLKEWRRLNTLLSGTNAVVWEVDSQTGCFCFVSTQAERLLGYPAEEWLEQDFCQLHVHPNDLDWVKGFLTHPAIATNNATLDFRMFNSNEECRWLRIIGALLTERQGNRVAGLLLDVTQEKHSEQRIAYLINHDPLTGLINRRHFQERLEEQISYNRRYQASSALLFMDLDQFKYINDTYGHHTGDEYLRQVADHLRRHLRENDVVGRLGGDEFGVILPNTKADQALLLADRLVKSLNSQEFVHEERSTTFSASMGVVLLPEHGDHAGELLAKADTAMYKAKDQGRNTFALFEEGAHVTYMQEKIHWEERIRRALRDNRFQLYFQPIVDLQKGAVSHYESLLRMHGDQGEIFAPGAFIGVAERFGQIRDIDHWVVVNALQTQGDSIRNGKPVSLTVNLSGRHFGTPQILEIIEEATERFAANPNSIVFEVTETAAVENFTHACTFIQALREKGYRIALDDFGSGFSSFDYLKHIPVDYIKIDGSFVRNLHRSEVDRIFVNAIASLARGLNVATVAEFVENRETVDILLELGVPFGQGYFFAKPAPQFQIVQGIPPSSTESGL
ncbi:MAG: EAL domain-containing protein [Gammaproteobacteria bacterium]|nr:EAL domain-containing protein [Gammaproteobacteria bacterium]MCP5458038.1 EAL domain-containing protein [Gammaproteobacteria bacterium]